MDVLRDGNGRACVPVKRAGVYSLRRFRRRGGCECISYCRWRPGPPSVWGHAAASVRDRIEEKSAYLISFYFCSVRPLRRSSALNCCGAVCAVDTQSGVDEKAARRAAFIVLGRAVD